MDRIVRSRELKYGPINYLFVFAPAARKIEFVTHSIIRTFRVGIGGEWNFDLVFVF